MRVAIVAQDWFKSTCNGTQTSAVALCQHSLTLGHDATLIAFTKSGKPSINFIESGIPIQTYKVTEYYKVLNSFDAIFFSAIGYRPSRHVIESIKIDDIEKPFSVMVHAEEQHRLYKAEIQKVTSHDKCRSIAVVAQEGIDDLQLSIPCIIFYPCTLPAYLLQKDHEWVPSDQTSGLVYAARIISYKTPNILAQLTTNNKFMDECKQVHVYGVPAGRSGVQLESKCDSYNPRWNRHKDVDAGYFNVYDESSISSMFKECRFYWDVFKVKSVETYFRRWNLGAAEAARFGAIPIVSPKVAPIWTHDFSVLIDPENWDPDEVADQIHEVNANIDTYRSRMREKLLSSPYSLESVKNNIASILETLS